MVALNTLLALGCAFFANVAARPIAGSSVDVVDVAHEVMCLTADGSFPAACSVGRLIASFGEVASTAIVASITPVASIPPMAVIVPSGGDLPSAGFFNMASVAPATNASSPAKFFPTASLFPPPSRSPLAVGVPAADGSPTGFLLPISSPHSPMSGSPVAFFPSMANSPPKTSSPPRASTPPTTSVSKDQSTAFIEETIVPSSAAPSSRVDITTTQEFLPPVAVPTDHVDDASRLEKPSPTATPSGKDNNQPEVKDNPTAPNAGDHKDDDVDKKKPLVTEDVGIEGLDDEIYHRICCVYQETFKDPDCESSKCATLKTDNSGGIILSEAEISIFKRFSKHLQSKREPSGATDVKDIPTPVKGHRTTLPPYLWNTPCARCTSDQCPTSCPFPVDDDHKGHGDENKHDDRGKDDHHKKTGDHKKDDHHKNDEHHKNNYRHEKDNDHEKDDNHQKRAPLETTSTLNSLQASKRDTESKDHEEPHAYVRVAQDGGAMNNPGPHPPKGWLSSVIPLGDTMSPKARHELELKEKAKAEAAAAANLEKQNMEDDLGKAKVDGGHENRGKTERLGDGKTPLTTGDTGLVEKRGRIERHRDRMSTPGPKDIKDVTEEELISTTAPVEDVQHAKHIKREEDTESAERSPDIKNVENTGRSEDTETAGKDKGSKDVLSKRYLLEWAINRWDDFVDGLEWLGLKDKTDVHLEQRSLQSPRLEPRDDEFAPDYSGKDIEVQEKDFFTRKYVHEDVRPQTLGDLGGSGLGSRMCCKCPPGKCPILCKGTVCTPSEDYHRKGMTLAGTRSPSTPGS